jgi:L-lactate permease
MWNQVYDPFSNTVLSTIAAALPVVTLLVLIASNKVKAHIAAIIALIVANVIAIFLFTMPSGMALRATVLGAVTGFFPIGWIVLNVIFLYRLTVEKGAFEILQTTIGGVTKDRRLQLLLIAFSFGAFFEGASGFGTPVAVTGAILIGLGFSPLAASGLSLIANTAPVAYGALGTPIAGLASVTGLDPYLLGAMVGRQLPFFSLIVPFWLIWTFAGRRGMLEIWPAILVCGVSFAVPQFLISNFINPWIVDIGASLISMACLILFLQVWRPKELWLSPALRSHDDSGCDHGAKATGQGDGADTSAGVVGIDAVDHRVRYPFGLGYRSVQGVRQSGDDLDLSGSESPRIDQQGGAGRDQADTGRRGICIYVAFLYGLRHADCRHYLGVVLGVFASAAGEVLRRDHQGVRLFAGHDLGDVGDRNAHAALGN